MINYQQKVLQFDSFIISKSVYCSPITSEMAITGFNVIMPVENDTSCFQKLVWSAYINLGQLPININKSFLVNTLSHIEISVNKKKYLELVSYIIPILFSKWESDRSAILNSSGNRLKVSGLWDPIFFGWFSQAKLLRNPLTFFSKSVKDTTFWQYFQFFSLSR